MIRPPENEAEMRRFYQDLCAKTNQIDTFYNVRGVNYVSGQDITDEINNATSDVIVIPPGTYTVSGDITLTNKTLTGSGTLNFTAGDVYFTNTSGTHGINGITFINATIWVSLSTNVFITNNTVKDVDDESAIVVHSSCSNIHITGNKIIETGADQLNSSGIFIAGLWGGVTVPCTDIVVSKNILIDAGQLGIESFFRNHNLIRDKINIIKLRRFF